LDCRHDGDCVAAPATLEDALTTARIRFERAVGRGEWRTKLRSGRFNSYLIYKALASESDVFGEVNEAVWAGDGLIVITDQPSAMPSLREALELDLGGSLRPSTITAREPLPVGPIALDGRAVSLHLD